MLNKITLKFGANPQDAPLEFGPGPITVFVGPNYSGKSKLIREVQWAVQHGRPDSGGVILKSVKLDPIHPGEVDAAISRLSVSPGPGEVAQPGHIFVGRLGSRQQVGLDNLKAALLYTGDGSDAPHLPQWAGQWYYTHTMRLLDGQSRIALTNDQPFGDLGQPASTTFQAIFRDDDLREKVRGIVYDAFGLYLVADPTNAGSIRLRLSQNAPTDLNEEQGLTQRSAIFHNAATLLAQASDGTRAFCGILIEVMAGKPDLLMLDEPEAFLHPTLSYKLGLEMARQIQNTSKNILVSTHSPNFLMGCIASGVPVNVVRLTYRGGNATARVLPSDQLSTIMRNPLLRSAGVLSALFYENVVVTEGDSDRAFYREINERLLSAADGRGIPNALFINANGKDAIPVMMEPLRRLGIPAAGVYDLDFVKDGGSVATRRLAAAGVPGTMMPSLGAARSSVKGILEAASANFKRDGGITQVAGTERVAVDAYLRQLSEFGLFLVPLGEVEGWLKSFGIAGHAAEWLIPMFTMLGEEGATNYVLPGAGDVWAFVDQMRIWLGDPSRLGLM